MKIKTCSGIFAVAVAALWLGCGSNTEPKSDATIQGRVSRLEDGTGIAGANVVLYDANANAPMARALTNAQGDFTFKAPGGNYSLTAAAQGRIPSPPPNGGNPLPFQAVVGGTYTRNLSLEIDSAAAGTGSVSGAITVTGSSGRGGILIVAVSGSAAYSTVTGPDGVFLLYNLPAGTYTLQGYKGGLAQNTTVVQVTVTAGGSVTSGTITFTADPGKTLRGRVTFSASQNSVVDITLVNPLTRDAIPGLNTIIDAATRAFTLTGIPPGDYIGWASFRNDDYVMDPDAIQKNGLPRVTFVSADTAKVLDFIVTDAIPLVNPTHPDDSVIPVAVTSLTPMFIWDKYPSAKEYILEVFDANGKRIWGGYDSLGAIRHPQVTVESTTFNFDGSATQALRQGGIYSWKVYADDDENAPGVQTLISSSEDLRGIFRVAP